LVDGARGNNYYFHLRIITLTPVQIKP
jgi:hypothetical protein